MDKGRIQMLSNKTKAQQYKAAMALTDEGLVDARIEVLESLLSDPHCEVTKGALNAIVSVMADRLEKIVLSLSIINKF